MIAGRRISNWWRPFVAAAMVWTIACRLGATPSRAAEEPPAWQALLEAERDAEAVPLLEAALREQPNDAELWRTLGWTYWRLGRIPDAERLWEQWRMLDENRPEPYDVLARAYLAQDRFEDAIAALRRLLELAPDHPEAPRMLASALRWAGHLPEAVERLRALHQQQPDKLDIMVELARALSSLWEYEEALELWRRIRAIEPDSIEYEAEEAWAALHVGAARMATAAARRILRRDPENVTALSILADEAEYGGRPTEALEWLERWLAVAESEDRGYLLGRLLALEERLWEKDPQRWPISRLIARARQRQEEQPHEAESTLRLAELLLKAEQLDEAETLLWRFLREFNPASLRARIALMEIALARGDYAAAERHFAWVRDFHPEDPYHLYRLARFYHQRGDGVAARRALDRLAEAGARGAVAVLLYHALTTSRYGPALSVAEFKDHIRALQAAGYTLLTPDRLHAWWERLGPKAGLMPDGRIRRAAMITFDDALENSFRFGTPVALDHGVQFALHIPTGNVERGDPYIASWDVIRRYAATGAWVFGSHLHYASDEAPMDPSGRLQGYAAAVRQWLPEEQRYETESEFFARLRDEYRRSREIIERETGQPARFVAYPYGEIGQERISNVPEARDVHLAYAAQHYDIGFIQSPFAHATRDANPLLYPRHEFPLLTPGKDVVNHLLDHHPCILAERTRMEIAAADGRPAEAWRAWERLRDYGYPEDRLEMLARALRGMTSRQFAVPDTEPTIAGHRTPPVGARTGAGVVYYENNLDTTRTRWHVVAEKILPQNVLLSAEAGFGETSQPRPAPAASPAAGPVRLDERLARLSLAWVGTDRTVVAIEAGLYDAAGDADRRLAIGAVELSGRVTPEWDMRLRLARELPEDAVAIAEGLSLYQGTAETVWSPLADYDVVFAADLRRYSDGNRRTALMIGPRYRPLDWRGVFIGARYAFLATERDAPSYWTPERYEGVFGAIGYRGRAFRGYGGVEAQAGLARERGFASLGEPSPPAEWEPACNADLYWSSEPRRRLVWRLQAGYSRTPDYEELRAESSARLRF